MGSNRDRHIGPSLCYHRLLDLPIRQSYLEDNGAVHAFGHMGAHDRLVGSLHRNNHRQRQYRGLYASLPHAPDPDLLRRYYDEDQFPHDSDIGPFDNTHEFGGFHSATKAACSRAWRGHNL